MNKILTIFFVGITLVTFAGEIYYGVDKNGNMFMSDRPLPTEIKEDPNSFGKKNPLEQAEIKRKNQEVEKQNKEVKRKAEDRVRQIKITNQMEQKQMAEEEKIAPDNIKIEARGVHNNYRSLDQFLKKYPKYAYLIGVKMLFFIKEGKFESTVSWASKCFSELNFDPSQKKEYLVFLVDLYMSGGAIGEYQKFVSLPQKSFSLEPPKIYEETRSWDPKGDTRKFLFQQKEDAINLLALYTLKTLDPRYSLNKGITEIAA